MKPGWEEAERSGTLAVGPGTGWDPLGARELADGEPGPGPAAPAARCKGLRVPHHRARPRDRVRHRRWLSC